jgi:hypothetical protein
MPQSPPPHTLVLYVHMRSVCVCVKKPNSEVCKKTGWIGHTDPGEGASGVNMGTLPLTEYGHLGTGVIAHTSGQKK